MSNILVAIELRDLLDLDISTSEPDASARRWHAALSDSECLSLYMDQSPQPVFEAETGARRATMDELLQDSDVVSVHVPLSAETKGLLNAMANLAVRNVVLAGDPPITPVPR